MPGQFDRQRRLADARLAVQGGEGGAAADVAHRQATGADAERGAQVGQQLLASDKDGGPVGRVHHEP